ncbi:MAG: tetratricopeptide repeat protein, partial [Anaerolineae bacterium]|nr:tetratricopeptide repeat protein [Anaerolineae bacterium]
MSTSQQLQQAFQYIKNGQQQEAAQILVPIVRAEPNNADAWWLLANAVTNGEQQRRALEKVLSLRPGDERAQKKLSQLTGAPTPPPPSSVAPTVMIPTSQMQQQIQAQSDPFANDPFADIPASSGTDPFGQPASSYTTTRTTTSYSSAQQQPPGAYPPSYGTPNPYGAPSPYGAPPPIAAPPPKKRGCNCCLVVFILMLVAVIACVGVILVGGASVTNSIFGGDPVSVLLGTSRPAADSLFGQALGTAGVGSISELLGTTTAVFGEFGEDASALATQAAATMNASGFSGDANAMMTQAVQTANALGFS